MHLLDTIAIVVLVICVILFLLLWKVIKWVAIVVIVGGLIAFIVLMGFEFIPKLLHDSLIYAPIVFNSLTYLIYF